VGLRTISPRHPLANLSAANRLGRGPARRGAPIVALMACLSFLAGCGPSATSEEISQAPARLVPTPKRTPGLWSEKLTMASGGADAEVTLCLDAITDQKLSWWGQTGAVGQCQKHEVTQNPDGSWNFAALCKGTNGTSAAVSGSVTGDFNTNYQVIAISNIQGSPDPNIAGQRRFTIDALRLGPCPAGMPPGSMDMQGVGRLDAMTGHLIH